MKFNQDVSKSLDRTVSDLEMIISRFKETEDQFYGRIENFFPVISQALKSPYSPERNKQIFDDQFEEFSESSKKIEDIYSDFIKTVTDFESDAVLAELMNCRNFSMNELINFLSAREDMSNEEKNGFLHAWQFFTTLCKDMIEPLEEDLNAMKDRASSSIRMVEDVRNDVDKWWNSDEQKRLEMPLEWDYGFIKFSVKDNDDEETNRKLKNELESLEKMKRELSSIILEGEDMRLEMENTINDPEADKLLQCQYMIGIDSINEKIESLKKEYEDIQNRIKNIQEHLKNN